MTPYKTLLLAGIVARIALEDRIQPAGKVVDNTVGESSAEFQSTMRQNSSSRRASR
jgi:hypothetical protein